MGIPNTDLRQLEMYWEMRRYRQLCSGRALSPRECPVVLFPNVLRGQVRVDLGCCDAGVAKHLLNVTQRRAAAEHVRREGVSKCMWSDVVRYAGGTGGALEA